MSTVRPSSTPEFALHWRTIDSTDDFTHADYEADFTRFRTDFARPFVLAAVVFTFHIFVTLRPDSPRTVPIALFFVGFFAVASAAVAAPRRSTARASPASTRRSCLPSSCCTTSACAS